MESATDCYKALLTWAAWVKTTLCWKDMFATHGLPGLCVWMISDVVNRYFDKLCECSANHGCTPSWVGHRGWRLHRAKDAKWWGPLETSDKKHHGQPLPFAISFQNRSELFCGIDGVYSDYDLIWIRMMIFSHVARDGAKKSKGLQMFFCSMAACLTNRMSLWPMTWWNTVSLM